MPLLLLLVAVLAPVLHCASSDAVDFDSMTWASWTREFHAAEANDSQAPLYANGPRVRAKILAADAVTLEQLREGEAIFRQRVSDAAGVGSVERVALEFVQTDARHENATAAFAVSLGISALPLPSTFDGRGDSDSTSVFNAAVDRERMRIIDALRSGTVENLHLFGSTMRLLDLSLDGETFYPIDLKPWVDVHLVLTSTSTAPSTALDDPFTNLKVRLSIARLLRAAQIDSSDVIIRQLHGEKAIGCGDAPIDVPSSAYSADVALVRVEIHVESTNLFPVMVTRLLNATGMLDIGRTSSLALADTVSAVDAQLMLVAIDVDPMASTRSVASTSTHHMSLASEGCIVSFTVNGFPIASLKQRRWQVLDGVLSLVSPFSVATLTVSFDSISLLAPLEEEDAVPLSSDWNEPVRVLEGSSLSPMDAKRCQLHLHVNALDGEVLDLVKLRELLAENVSSSASELRDLLLGDSSTAATSSIALDGVYEASSKTADTPDAFVDFNLTLVLVKDLEVNITSTEGQTTDDVFQVHAIRSALVLLLQQIGIVNADLLLLSNIRAIFPIASKPPSFMRTSSLNFRVGILDESQRQGVRRIVLSRRLVTTVATYTRESLALVAQSVNTRADNSLARPQYLPGSLLPFPSPSLTSNSIERVSLPQLDSAPLSYFVYRFHVPDATGTSPASSVQWNWASTTLHKTKVCFSIRVRSDLSSKRLFLQEISSVSHLTGASLALPTPTRVTPTNWSSAAAAATTAGNTTISGLAQWVVPPASDGAATWTFATELDSVDAGDAVWSLHLDFSYMEGSSDANRVATDAFSLIVSLDGTTGELHMRKVQGLDLESHVAVDSSESVVPSYILVSSGIPNVTMLRTGSVTTSGTIVTSGVKVAIDLSVNTSVTWGLYPEPDSTSSSCSECLTDAAATNACSNSPGACAALTTCFRSIADANLLAAASILSPTSSVDFSWALASCLSPSDGTIWQEALMPVLNNTYRCLWTQQCPLGLETMSAQRVALHHEPAEQIVKLSGGNVTLLFTLDVDGGELDGGVTRTFTFSGSLSTSDTDDVSQLGDALTDFYRSFSDVALAEVVVTTNTTEGVELSLRYSFLGKLTIPFLSVISSSSFISVSVMQPTETLTLRVVD